MAQNFLSAGLLFGILYHGYLLGRVLFFKFHWTASLLPGVLLFLAVQGLIQTGWYYSGYLLGRTSDLASFIGAIIFTQAIYYILKRKKVPAPETTNDAETKKGAIISVLLLFAAASSTGLVIRAAFLGATSESIRTPWPLLSENTLAYILLSWTCLFLSVLLVRSAPLAALHSALALGGTLAIAPLVYRLGFGFDGFLHIASEKIILAAGTLDPKPLYYIGQYVFTTWLSRIADLPLPIVDRWLVPFSAALILPYALLLGTRNKQTSAFNFLVLGLVPLSAFVATTPQGFAYVLGAAALLLVPGLPRGTVHPLAPALLALWSAATHPLAGIPLLFIVLGALSCRLENKNARRVMTSFCVFMTGLAIPILFYLISQRGQIPIIWNIRTILEAKPWLERLTSFIPAIGNRFVLWPAWASLASRAAPLLLLFALLSWFKAEKGSTERQTLGILTLSALTLWSAATALKSTGDFTFLIDYERGNYADRLNQLALFSLLPAATLGAGIFWNRIFLWNGRRGERIVAQKAATLALLGFALALATGLAYDALPRHDALVTGRGWSVSRHDVEAVQLIDRDAGGREYAVLANQSVSAAAVSALGFKRYAGDIFFYPIPTSGPLYQTFLNMTYRQPSIEIVKDAAALGKTDLVYFVLNKYWWRAESVAEKSRQIADRDWTLGDGAVMIYKFDLAAARQDKTKSSKAETETSGR